MKMNNIVKAKQLREKRAAIWEEMQAINQANEGRSLNKDDQVKWDNMSAEMTALKSDIERFERTAELESEASEKRQINIDAGIDVDQLEETQAKNKAEYKKRFSKIIRAIRSGNVDPADEKFLKEYRGTSTQIAGTTTLGGFLVPEDFSFELEKYKKQFGGMLQACRVIQTGNGADLPWPTVNDTANVGALITEGTAGTVSDVTFASNTLQSFTYYSKVIKASWELIQDSAFPLDQLIAEIAGERIGRIVNQHFTTGDGSGKPYGFITDASSGKTAAANNAITYAEILDLKHSVDPAYRTGPNAYFMFNDSTLAAIKKLSVGSSDARPLWQPGVSVGAPDTIDGTPYIINQDMASIGSETIPVAFGDFSKYVIRQVLGDEMVVLRERYADERANGYFVYSRYDGKLINTDAIKYLTMAV